MKKVVAGLIVSVLPFWTAQAKVSDYDAYFEQAGNHYNIPPLLLKSIAKIESNGNPGAVRVNQNGTRDYGLMQINSIHFKRLQEWGITERNIMDPQINIFAGSWLLSEHIRQQGFNLKAVGSYHSKTDIHRDRWLRRLIVALKSSPHIQ